MICLDKESPQNTAESINSILSNKAVTARLLDVTDHGQVDAAFGEIAEQHGSIDVMVNNAGVAHHVADLWIREMKSSTPSLRSTFWPTCL